MYYFEIHNFASFTILPLIFNLRHRYGQIMILAMFEIAERERDHGKKFLNLRRTSCSGNIHYQALSKDVKSFDISEFCQ